MSITEIEKTKSDLIHWIETMSDIDVLSFLDVLKAQEENEDWWDNLSTREQHEINEGIKQADNGQTVSSQEFWRRVKNG